MLKASKAQFITSTKNRKRVRVCNVFQTPRLTPEKNLTAQEIEVKILEMCPTESYCLPNALLYVA